MVHIGGSLKVVIDWVGVADGCSTSPLLLHVSAAHQLGSKVEVLSLRLLQVGGDLLESILQVALVRVEHDRLIRIVLAHHLESNPRDGRLEVRLLSIDHYTHVQLLSGLEIEGWLVK